MSFSLRESRRPSPRSRNLFIVFANLHFALKLWNKPWWCFFWATWWLLSFTTAKKYLISHFKIISQTPMKIYQVPLTCPHVPVSTFRSLFSAAASPLAHHGADHGAHHHRHDGAHRLLLRAPNHSTLAPPSSRNCAVPFPIDRHYFSLWPIKAAEALAAIFSAQSQFSRANLSS